MHLCQGESSPLRNAQKPSSVRVAAELLFVIRAVLWLDASLHVPLTATVRDEERSPMFLSVNPPSLVPVRTDGMPAPTPAGTEMPVDMPVDLPGDTPAPFDLSFSYSFDMEDDGRLSSRRWGQPRVRCSSKVPSLSRQCSFSRIGSLVFVGEEARRLPMSRPR